MTNREIIKKWDECNELTGPEAAQLCKEATEACRAVIAHNGAWMTPIEINGETYFPIRGTSLVFIGETLKRIDDYSAAVK